MKQALANKKRSRAKALLRVEKGSLVPNDAATVELLRARKYKLGDVLAAELSKPRSPKFHRLAHSLGGMLAENIEAFAGMDAHRVLKRLQIEGRIACDEIPIHAPGVGPCAYFIPLSLSFESMDDGEFHEVIAAFCAYVSHKYWPSLEPEQIEQMAEIWVAP